MENFVAPYFHRDISWLSFNFRVLQEAQNPLVPLYEKIKFLSIFSSNLDEFFRIRYPTLLAIQKLPETAESWKILSAIHEIIQDQQIFYGKILSKEILPALLNQKIHLYFKEPLHEDHTEAVVEYFYSQVLSFLQPVFLKKDKERIKLKNNALYFAVELKRGEDSEIAILNIPHQYLPRFATLPEINGVRQIIFLDDVIRYNIDKAFPGFSVQRCFCVKLTRNADISLTDEWSEMLEEEVVTMLEAREAGEPSRFLYEEEMPEDMRNFFKDYLGLTAAELIQGGRYHNLRDLASLPNPDGNAHLYPHNPPLRHLGLKSHPSVFDAIDAADHLLHFPYQSYNYILRFFNEAAISPDVEEIFVTLYRVAADSHIVNALISAAKNGKKVTAVIELKARFDEENNLKWAKKMKSAGVRIVYSIPKLKVHAKLALVKKASALHQYFALLSTGNFNENTAKFYTDHLLLTSDEGITKEVKRVFEYLKERKLPKDYRPIEFEHLLVAGFNLMDELNWLILREIENTRSGKEARIIIKINNLEEKGIIDLLYQASKNGVKIDLIVRGICCLIPGIPGLSENIRVTRIVDQYLEHARVFIFHNGGNWRIFLGSADLMNRNLHRRIEVLFPLYDVQLKNEVIEIIQLQLKDNIQAVELDSEGKMRKVSGENTDDKIQSQREIRSQLAGKSFKVY